MLADTGGLTSQEAARRLAADGRNEVLAARATGPVRAVLHQLTDTVILVLLVAAGLTALVRDGTDTAVILAVVVLNTTLGAVQEVRSARALEALADLTAPQATVVRDGVDCAIDAREVVRGDLIRTAAGDIVPADARVVLAESMLVDESMLTGESDHVAKRAGDTLFSGTVVTRGRGAAVVESVAAESAIGTIAESLRSAAAVQTPLQRQLAVLGRRLAVAVSMIAVLVALLNVAWGHGWETSIVLAISLAVAAIPESLPAVVSLSLAMAARRMAARGVLARRLAAVEALGSVTVLASDKTGTLTEGRMSVTRSWTAPDVADGVRLLEAAVLCNDACTDPSGKPGVRDDPTEVALVRASADAGIDVAALRARFARIGEVPFDAVTARMTTTHRAPDGHVVTICKGSPEGVLGELADDPRARRQAHEWAAEGRRVLAVAVRDGGPWRLLGLVALADPPRAEAIGMIEAFRRVGVRPVMITGDHPATARAIAVALGLSAPGQPTGTAEQCADGGDHDVYARVRPEEKTAIVAALRSRGDIVAMTGDGVNDAPALRAADIGVAMGRRGTEVAKQAADLILVDDDLSALVPAIAEGRRAYDNLRRFLHYALSGGVAEILLMLFGPAFGFAVPLQAGQILWVNLLTHGLPGVAMGSEPAAPDVLRRPPRPPREELLDRITARRVAVLGTVIAVLCVLAGLQAKAADRPWQSVIFVSLALAQLGVAVALRPLGAWRVNTMLPAAVLLNVGLTVLAVTWQPLMDLLRTDTVAARDWIVAAAAAVVAAGVARWQVRASNRGSASGGDLGVDEAGHAGRPAADVLAARADLVDQIDVTQGNRRLDGTQSFQGG